MIHILTTTTVNVAAIKMEYVYEFLHLTAHRRYFVRRFTISATWFFFFVKAENLFVISTKYLERFFNMSYINYCVLFVYVKYIEYI